MSLRRSEPTAKIYECKFLNCLGRAAQETEPNYWSGRAQLRYTDNLETGNNNDNDLLMGILVCSEMRSG